MGHTIWVEIQGQPLEETAQDSSIMHRLMDELDALAVKLNVAKLSDFLDYSELEEAYGDLEGDDEDDDEDDAALEHAEPTLQERQLRGEWFDCADGFRSISTLRAHLREHFEDLGFVPDEGRSHWPVQLMDELAHSERVIGEAAQHQLRFRLLIVA